MIDFNVKENIKSANKDIVFIKRLQSLRKMKILVGIPEANSTRKKGKKINNAALLYLHTKGSPLRNLPSRPVIEPALEAQDNADKISDDLREVAKMIIDGEFAKAKSFMGVTGQDAVNIIKAWFDDPRNNWEPNKDATVKAKLRKTRRSLKWRKKKFEEYEAGTEGINKVLVDTAQMKNAIVYVIEGNE